MSAGLLVGAGLTLVFRRPDVTLFECMRPGDAIAARQVLSARQPALGLALTRLALTRRGVGHSLPAARGGVWTA